ncbi:hypothetical protein BX070DRAFT_25640 [Coemansia spiralis]|nr:hypothetical protein BX070DRAFT_25640 [Coemansia spiralis]
MGCAGAGPGPGSAPVCLPHWARRSSRLRLEAHIWRAETRVRWDEMEGGQTRTCLRLPGNFLHCPSPHQAPSRQMAVFRWKMLPTQSQSPLPMSAFLVYRLAFRFFFLVLVFGFWFCLRLLCLLSNPQHSIWIHLAAFLRRFRSSTARCCRLLLLLVSNPSVPPCSSCSVGLIANSSNNTPTFSASPMLDTLHQLNIHSTYIAPLLFAIPLCRCAVPASNCHILFYPRAL